MQRERPSPFPAVSFNWTHRRERIFIILELLVILLAAFVYAGTLLDFNAAELQQSGEHNESATRPLVAEIGLKRYGEIPLWNHFMQTGFPMVGDIVNHFWSPVATLPVLIWGGINGMKVSIFLSFLLAGWGQWYLARVCGLRGIFRLWSSLLFMLSGGLALLWRLGWYELLVGAVWFPWAFASFWQSLHSRTRKSLVWAALCSSMVLLTGGGYYPLYLSVAAGVILVMALVLAKSNRRYMFGRALIVAALIVGLTAVMTLPILDGYRLIIREAGIDLTQTGSQPIPYALFNYVVSEPAWFTSGSLGTLVGYTWFYLGALALAFLVFWPLAYRNRRNRPALITMTILFVVLLAWHADRFPPFKYIYDWFPFLYQWRFPNRLLYIAASPLLIISGAGFQAAYVVARRKLAPFRLSLSTRDTSYRRINLRVLVTLGIIVIVVLNLADVYTVNQSVAFAPSQIEPKSYQALRWLKNQDPSLYYTGLGPGINWWAWWSTAAVDLEMPVFNFYYNERLATRDAQQAPESPIAATPKYQFIQMRDPAPTGGQLLREFEGVGLWYMPTALPFAFTVPDSSLNTREKLTPGTVTAVSPHFDGPNRVTAKVNSASAQGDTLVVLVSDYPGWRLQIDGQPAQLTAINAYLGARVLPGEHTYTFEFDPPLYRLGLLITAITVLVIVVMLLTAPENQRIRRVLLRTKQLALSRRR